jgi:large subunit ribosomal protein L21
MFIMTTYAIVQASGKQFWVEEGRFYDFDKLPLSVGDMFKLNRVLLVNRHSYLQLGKPFLGDECLIEATVIRHISGSKVRVYKMRPKKKTRKTFGSRAKLTRVLVNSITTVAKNGATCYL